MLLGLIENGLVVNVVVADADTPDWPGYFPLPEGVWIGWAFDGLTFTAPEVDDAV